MPRLKQPQVEDESEDAEEETAEPFDEEEMKELLAGDEEELEEAEEDISQEKGFDEDEL